MQPPQKRNTPVLNSTYQNDISIACPQLFQSSIKAMEEAHCLETFAIAWLRLMNLITSYLATSTLDTRKRVATIWADPHVNTHGIYDWNWLILDQPCAASNRFCDGTVLLAGGLVYHEFNNSWGIHT
jgi:hypothetical protein